VEADRPDEADVPPDGRADRRDDQAAGGRTARPAGTEAETRSRQECYEQLRVAEAKEKSEAAQRTTAEEQAATDKWNEDATESRGMWTEYLRKWPPEERQSADKPAGPPGSWRGDRDRSLDPAENARVEAECDRIAEREEQKLSPAMRAIESQDPDRHLIGLKDCLKGRDRVKEKVYDKMEEFDFSPEEAVSSVSDTIRYTFQYRESHYTRGVWADIERLKAQGFELNKLKNAWSGEEYKGFNSQWSEPDTGQRFEVQFHTRISFEAKQLTHDAYERLRTQQADEFEKMVLKAFQRKVSGEVPIPPGAADLPDYPERGVDAR
jgi:hypothetical protein